MKFKATVFCMICRDLAQQGDPINKPCVEQTKTFATLDEAKMWARINEPQEGDTEIEEVDD